MKAKFNITDISGSLGVAPATAERITGLLNGTINPDHFRSVDAGDPLSQFGVPPQTEKILNCLAYLLNGKVQTIVGSSDQPEVPFIDRNDLEVPTILFSNNEFTVDSPAEFIKYNFQEAVDV